jgi:hypothetical protein
MSKWVEKGYMTLSVSLSQQFPGTAAKRDRRKPAVGETLAGNYATLICPSSKRRWLGFNLATERYG